MLTTHACMGEAQAQLLRLLGTRLTGSGRLGTCRGRARATAGPPDASASRAHGATIVAFKVADSKPRLAVQALDEAKAMTHDSFA